MAVGSQQHVPAALSPGKSACTHCRGGWLGPMVGLNGMRMRKLLPRPGFETQTVPPVAIRCNTLPGPRVRSPLGLTCFLNTVHVVAFTLGGSCQTTQGSGPSISVHVSRETSERHSLPSSLLRSAVRSGKTQRAHNVQQYSLLCLWAS
jgi:hypothetical protein